MRIYRQKKRSPNVRGGLYPVKRGAENRAEYGSSGREELDRWAKEKRGSLFNEIRSIVSEFLLLSDLKKENPRLWKVSFLFHFGCYLVIGTLALLVLGAFSMALGIPIAPGRGILSSLIYYLTILLGFLGLTLGTAATAALFRRHRKDPELRNCSSFSDYGNLAFLFVFFHIGMLAFLFHDPGFDGARAYVHSLLTFGGTPTGIAGGRSLLGMLAIILSSLLIAYIPLTHMSHMFMKFFMYRSVGREYTPDT